MKTTITGLNNLTAEQQAILDRLRQLEIDAAETEENEGLAIEISNLKSQAINMGIDPATIDDYPTEYPES